ncbi:MAG: phosphoadenosine phosphosulfate reductase family protein [Lachnospiraceae bacterium]|nr:phosphoadenosine phosphosulfate reductase family protein [Lachnospiraceae bacterium]
MNWCDTHNIPVFDDVCPLCGGAAREISADIRPVFPEEKLLLAIVKGKEPDHYQNKSVWNISKWYIVDGKKEEIRIGELNKLSLEDIEAIKKTYDANVDSLDYEWFETNISCFVEANKEHFDVINTEAISYIQSYKDRYDINDMMVSFSGGKDSTVTSHLVNTAFGTNKIIHIFGDTTLEFPTTIEYKKRFNKNEESKGVRILTAKNREKNFDDLVKVVGPPSRVILYTSYIKL